MVIVKYIPVVAVMVTMIPALSLHAEVVNITEGSTTGYTMTDGNTYIIQNSVSFSNSTVGGSGINIAPNATVVLYVPANVTLTTVGANGDKRVGGGAGILVPKSSTLVVTGNGIINASGGNAGNGGNGESGTSAELVFNAGAISSARAGSGAIGGSGGGGAGAGVGGSGGLGGGASGGNGGAGTPMGLVYVLGSLHVDASTGSNGSAGSNGRSGSGGYYASFGMDYYVTGGGGGGGGGAGSAPTCAIGGGGAAGGAGGSGFSGKTNSNCTYASAGATGGGGKSLTSSGSGGSGGSGGSAGTEGSAGSLYVSSDAVVNVERTMSLATTHSAIQYTIKFDANGGRLSSDVSEVTAALGCVLPDCVTVLERNGCQFLGWQDDNGVEYYGADGTKKLSSYSVPSGIVLRAEWIDDPNALVITPTDGTMFDDSVSVSMSSSVDGATIYFSLDGSDPTTDSSVYQRKFRINSKTTVKAIAVCEGWTSEVTVAHYALGQCPDPVVVSAGGETFSHGSMQISVDWDCADGVLRYTTDGSDVSETSPVYVGPFTIDETTTIKAKAFGVTYFDSQQVELTVTREWELVATPVISAAESFAGSKTVVSIACATEDATIRYTTDVSEPNAHSRRYAGPFEVRESTVVKAFATLADYKDSVVAMKTITKVWGIGDSVGLPDHAFTTDGDAEWVNDGGVAMRSGTITHEQVSVMRSTFIGKGRLTFELKTSCEEDIPQYMEYDRAEVWMNGALKMKQDGVHDWTSFEFNLDGASTTVEWRYVKDEVDDAKYPGEDCIWVRNIVWLPELTCTTEVPVELSWIREKFGDLGNYYYDYEDKTKATAANGHKVWECYVAGEDPTDKDSRFTAIVKIGADGKPILSWKPPLNGETSEGAGIREGVRSYRVYGKRNLDDVAEEWTPVVEGDEEDYRFFKVGVAMP